MLFNRVRLSPRWLAAGLEEAEVRAAYGASGASFAYRYRHDASRSLIMLDVEGKAEIQLHAMLPPACRAKRLRLNGRDVPVRSAKIQNSSYADAALSARGGARIELQYTAGTRNPKSES